MTEYKHIPKWIKKKIGGEGDPCHVSKLEAAGSAPVKLAFILPHSPLTSEKYNYIIESGGSGRLIRLPTVSVQILSLL